MTTSKLIMSALFTALIAVLAQVAIPLPFSPVPFTGQVIGVLLAGALLGKRAALLSILAYLLLGAAGAPVFSLGRGGIFMLAGPTGGYLWGFIPAVYCLAWLIETFEKRIKPGLAFRAGAMFTALIIIYCCGTLQLILIMRYSLVQGLLIGAAPFLPLDLVKVFTAAWLSLKIEKGLDHYH